MEFSFIIALIYLACGIVLFLLGFLIFREDARQRLNRITGAMLFLAGLGPILGAFGLLLESAGPMQDINIDLFYRIFLAWEFFFPQLVLFSLVFPFEHPVLKTHPKLTFFLFIPQTFHLLLALIFPNAESLHLLRQWLGLMQDWALLLQPIQILLRAMIALLEFIAVNHETYFAAINMAYVLTAITVMHFGLKRIKNPRLLTQTKWVLWGIRVSLGLYAIAFLVPQFLPLQISSDLAYLLTSASLLIGSGAIAWAIIRYQFLDIRFIIRRGFVFSVSSGLLIGAYLLVYGQAKTVVASSLGVNLPFVEVLFLILAIIAFQPILGLMESLVERTMLNGKFNHQQFLQSLSRELLSAVDIFELRSRITSSLKEALLLEHVHLLLEEKNNFTFTTTVDSVSFKDTRFDENEIEVEFKRNSQFLQLIARIDSPVYIEDIISQIEHEDERKALSRMRPKLIIPLRHHQELVGVLSVGPKITQRSFSYEDMTLLSLLSNQVAIEIANTRLYEEKLQKQRIDEELNLAREMQRMLLPHKFPDHPRFEISAINLPSLEVGGDVYDFVEIQDGVIGVAIGDVAGKGVPGAILMSNLLAVFRTSAQHGRSTNTVMQEVNAQISRTTTPGKYATFLYGTLSPADIQFTFSNAGHNYPIFMGRNQDPIELRHSDLIIGAVEQVHYHQHTIKLNRDDLLVLYTDGVTEAMNKAEQEFGLKRLLETICAGRYESAEGLRNRIYEAVLKFSGNTPQADDLTLVVVKAR